MKGREREGEKQKEQKKKKPDKRFVFSSSSFSVPFALPLSLLSPPQWFIAMWMVHASVASVSFLPFLTVNYSSIVSQGRKPSTPTSQWG
ncbi:hypothetical protein HOY82DRAFT_4501 [Tuber indicum]|nr:hypothetical protein HOY82DRAFT_4501 [Tuber indicum]